ncbi:MAG: tyrosine-type recombinase/integrase [Phycisphaerae bacterium]|nr:tyrosine-type recombinase/integrase [Phycisphaerae bacterium]
MARSRSSSNPVSYHRYTGQYYVTRAGRRVYLGTDKEEAIRRYHELGLGILPATGSAAQPATSLISLKDLANRFLTAQQANWRNPETTLKCYQGWLHRFLRDHRGMYVSEFTVERFAQWKLSLKKRRFAAESINHYLSAVRAIFRFAEDTGLVDKSPKLRRVKNEQTTGIGSKEKMIYTESQVRALLQHADTQMRTMILLALNCGFGPKDLHDVTWDDIGEDRITLPRSKTGICQTYRLWPETEKAIEHLKSERADKMERLLKRNRLRSDRGHVFVTYFWKPWSKDAIATQFRRLCALANVPCYGFYRLRHCAATAMSMVASPHVQRRFMRHSQLQQQVTYTHVPDAEVDKAVLKAKEKLLGQSSITSGQERNRESDQVA